MISYGASCDPTCEGDVECELLDCLCTSWLDGDGDITIHDFTLNIETHVMVIGV